MRRQSIVAYGEPLQETSADIPVPQGREVVVKVRHCGVCHSDLHMQDGYFSLGGDKQLDVRGLRSLPFTLGHEIEGEVAAVGPDADGVEIGDHRAVYPWIGCGACALCGTDEEIYCVKPRHLGITVDGGYATHALVPDAKYLLDFDGIDPAVAGTAMCSGLTALSALKKLQSSSKPVLPGSILIVGLGGVGMTGLEIAKSLFGVAPLVADIDAEKRDAAMALGALAAFDPRDREARREIMKHSNGGVAGAVDFAGAEGSMNFALGALRKGGKLVVAGLIGGRFEMPIPMFPLRAIGIEGSYVGTLEEAHELLAMIRKGDIAPIPVEKRPLDTANATLDQMREGKIVGRVVLTPASPADAKNQSSGSI